MFTDTCPVCTLEAEIISQSAGFAHVKCGECGYSYKIELTTDQAQRLGDWFFLLARYPVGSFVKASITGKLYSIVEVVGHKVSRLLDDQPAVTVQHPISGTVLLSRRELKQWNKE